METLKSVMFYSLIISETRRDVDMFVSCNMYIVCTWMLYKNVNV